MNDLPEHVVIPSVSEPESALFAADLNVLSVLPWPSPIGTPEVSFGDSSWRLDSISTWPAYSVRSDLNWITIQDPNWRLLAKEVALCMMQPRISIDRRVPLARMKAYPPWALPYQRLFYWRRWFNYLSEHGHYRLATVTQETCDAYLSTIKPDSRHIAITAIRAFSEYAPLPIRDRYADSFRPWGRRSAASASGQPSLGEASNKTPAIPDRVFAPTLSACLFLVDEIGPGIIAARAEKERLIAIPSPWGGSRADFDSRLDNYLAELRRDSTPVPSLNQDFGRTHAIDLHTVALNLGLRDQQVLLRQDRWAKLVAAADELGLAPGGLRIVDLRFSFSTSNLKPMTRITLTACYVVVAGLSGLRSSEIAAIERSAYGREVHDGGVVRFRLRSKLLKGEPPGGKQEVWTVISPVVQALKLAEALDPAEHPLALRLFSSRFRELREWVNDEGAEHQLSKIPSDWELRPRQFRRTLAREIAWRPNGVISGKIHLKHISVATTEGYAGKRGESASSFMAEVDSERRRVAKEETRAAIEAIERGEPIAGLGARALTAAVAALPDYSSDGPQVRDREDAIVALVRSRADVLHLTPLVYCWFTNPERARCLRGVSDKSRPIVGSCQPERCANATIHPQHASVWLSGIETLKATLKDRRVPDGERARINAKADLMTKTISPFLQDRS